MGSTRKLFVGLAAVLAAASLVVLAPGMARPAEAATLVQVTNFGANPGSLAMYAYVPASVSARPAVLVAMHPCGGSGPGYHQSTEFASLADRYGFIVIYPSSTKRSPTGLQNCFDTWSDSSKVRGSSVDAVSVVSMVTYTEQHYSGDPSRVYATGSSSGAMMTDAVTALYPDVFKAGAPFMGVPFACFATPGDYIPGTGGNCTGGRVSKSPQQWGDLVRQANPGYQGPWPRMQLWHGTTDTAILYAALQQEVDQWTNVHGLGQAPTSTDTPQSSWTRRRFADSSGTVRVEAITISGAGHTLPTSGMAAYAIAFFGLDRSTPPPSPPAGR